MHPSDMIAVDCAPSEAISEKSEKHDSKYLTQWTQAGDDLFVACGPTQKELVPGLYDIFLNNGSVFFKKIKHSTKRIIKFDESACDEITNEINIFWNSKDKYKNFDVQYKRGILFHGPQGSGKSSIIKLVIQNIIARGGIAVSFSNPHVLGVGLQNLRAIEPNKPVVVIMEDLDAIMQYQDQSSVLNMLDGSTSTIDNVLFLATTNYPELLEDRIKDRPSRFDRVIAIPCPSITMRTEYILQLFLQKDLEIVEEKLAQWAADTEGFSFSHITELFLSVELYNKTYEEALETISSMSKSLKSDSYKTTKQKQMGVGFKSSDKNNASVEEALNYLRYKISDGLGLNGLVTISK